jgi:Tol biopolymer transport system component
MNAYTILRAGGAALALMALTACSDGVEQTTLPALPPDVVTQRPNHVPPATMYDSAWSAAVITCNVTVPGIISCTSPQGNTLGTGGKGVHTRLVPSLAGTSGGVFQFAGRIQNLMVNRIGTADGPTTAGLFAFVMAPPTTTAGSGSVTVNNADSTGTFTAANQPYFHYDTILSAGEASVNRLWRFNVPASVTSFQFKVYVMAPILPIIVFDKDEGGNRDIYRVNLDGTQLVRLTSTAGIDMDPTAVGSTVVFVSYRNSNAELYRMSLLGGAQTRLTSTSANETAPALSLDGTRLAYINDVTGVPKLWVGPLATLSNAAPVTGDFSAGNAVENDPAWDRSTRVAFTSTRGATPDVYFYAAAGGAITSAGGSNTLTAAEVEFAFAHDGVRQAWTTDRDGGNVEVYWRAASIVRLTNQAGIDAQPTFLSDGKLVTWRGTATPVLEWRIPGTATQGTINVGTGTVRNAHGLALQQ